jgi:hypothetical protein
MNTNLVTQMVKEHVYALMVKPIQEGAVMAVFKHKV